MRAGFKGGWGVFYMVLGWEGLGNGHGGVGDIWLFLGFWDFVSREATLGVGVLGVFVFFGGYVCRQRGLDGFWVVLLYGEVSRTFWGHVGREAPMDLGWRLGWEKLGLSFDNVRSLNEKLGFCKSAYTQR